MKLQTISKEITLQIIPKTEENLKGKLLLVHPESKLEIEVPGLSRAASSLKKHLDLYRKILVLRVNQHLMKNKA